MSSLWGVVTGGKDEGASARKHSGGASLVARVIRTREHCQPQSVKSALRILPRGMLELQPFQRVTGGASEMRRWVGIAKRRLMPRRGDSQSTAKARGTPFRAKIVGVAKCERQSAGVGQAKK